jgi:hypothetical protein
MISKSTGKQVIPTGGGWKPDIILATPNKRIEQVPQGDGINYSYNVHRSRNSGETWQFYKSAYILERAQEIYDAIK